MTEDRKLDWVPRHDERSRSYPIRTLLPPNVPWTMKMWRTTSIRLDQGSEGACVGFGITNELLSTPMPARFDNEQAHRYALSVYRQAKLIDEWEGENYDGTSVLAGMKVITAAGWCRQYRWAFGVADIITTLCTPARYGGGPVVIGIPWYSSMYETDRHGLVVVDGSMVGGHCILLTGYHPNMLIGGKQREVIRWDNSWGPSYGINGRGYITVSDLAQLLADYGEAAVLTGRKQVMQVF